MNISGYYAIRMPNAPDPLPDAVFSTPGVAGVYLRYAWRDIEPNQGVYDWSALNHDVQRALVAGKKISIGIRTGGFCPAWLYAAGSGIRSISYSAATHGGTIDCTNYTAPVPYDPPYATAYLAMLTALRAQLASLNALTALTIVKVTPFNDFSEELHLPSMTGGANTCESDAQSAWLALDYRPSKVLTAFKTIFDGMHKIFPTKVLAFDTISANSFPGISDTGQKVRRDNTLAEAIITYSLTQAPGQIAAEPTDLSSVDTNDVLAPWAWAQGAIVGWQSNEHGGNHTAGCPDNACDATGFAQLLQRAISSGAVYVELWPPDCENFSGELVANPV